MKRRREPSPGVRVSEDRGRLLFAELVDERFLERPVLRVKLQEDEAVLAPAGLFGVTGELRFRPFGDGAVGEGARLFGSVGNAPVTDAASQELAAVRTEGRESRTDALLRSVPEMERRGRRRIHHLRQQTLVFLPLEVDGVVMSEDDGSLPEPRALRELRPEPVDLLVGQPALLVEKVGRGIRRVE